MRSPLVLVVLAACSLGPRPFPLRDPLALDTDMHPVSVPCRRDSTKQEPDRMTCAPVEYVSPFAWNQVDNSVFAPLSRLLWVDLSAEAANANSLDEVADSAWFTNRVGPNALTPEQLAAGACKPEDMLPASDDVPDGAWVIDHGKDNGSTLGFRVSVPGKGKYLMKADDEGKPERASAASVIGADLYNAVGFSTSCEQVVVLRRGQVRLLPGLKTVDNVGISQPFDEAALDKVFASTTQVGTRVRMQASKWLPGVALGPFRYVGTRDDDPNDVVAHENRRELRGSRVLAAWINHWDAREQNSMDVWIARDAKHPRSSPGYVRHHILDTSDTLGGQADPHTLAIRLGHSYIIDFADVLVDFVTLGAIERPWDRVAEQPGREKFAYFSARDFAPSEWKPLYPNPAFVRMTERDGAWMARLIAKLSPSDLRTIAGTGQFTDPHDADYLTAVLVERQRLILERYFLHLSALGDARAVGTDQLCLTDFARLRGLRRPQQFHYTVVERGGGQNLELPVAILPDGQLCFRPRSVARAGLPDAAGGRIVTFEIRNGMHGGPLELHTYDLGERGMRVVGIIRPWE